MDRQEALAVSFANLKGPRDKDVIQTARALQSLKSLPDFGSNAAVGRAVGVSGEIVREFLSLLQLPSPVQELLEKRHLSLEQGRRLSQLAKVRPDAVLPASNAMVDLTAMDSRHLVDYLRKHPELSVPEAKEKILDSKPVTRREFHIVASLGEADYRELKRQAAGQGQTVDELVTKVVLAWLRDRNDDA